MQRNNIKINNIFCFIILFFVLISLFCFLVIDDTLVMAEEEKQQLLMLPLNQYLLIGDEISSTPKDIVVISEIKEGHKVVEVKLINIAGHITFERLQNGEFARVEDEQGNDITYLYSIEVPKNALADIHYYEFPCSTECCCAHHDGYRVNRNNAVEHDLEIVYNDIHTHGYKCNYCNEIIKEEDHIRKEIGNYPAKCEICDSTSLASNRTDVTIRLFGNVSFPANADGYQAVYVPKEMERFTVEKQDFILPINYKGTVEFEKDLEKPNTWHYTVVAEDKKTMANYILEIRYVEDDVKEPVVEEIVKNSGYEKEDIILSTIIGLISAFGLTAVIIGIVKRTRKNNH